MGMFDYVKAPEIQCPNCGLLLKDWQTKDGNLESKMLDFRAVNEFYTRCFDSSCRKSYKFIYINKNKLEKTDIKRPSCVYCGREAPDETRTIEDYKLTEY